MDERKSSPIKKLVVTFHKYAECRRVRADIFVEAFGPPEVSPPQRVFDFSAPMGPRQARRPKRQLIVRLESVKVRFQESKNATETMHMTARFFSSFR